MIIDCFNTIEKYCGYKAKVTFPKNCNKYSMNPAIVHLHASGGFSSVADASIFEDFVIIEPIGDGDIFDPDGVVNCLNTVLNNYPTMIDRDRIGVMGRSMGSRGCWDTICNYPDIFSFSVCISGFCCYLRAHKITHIPIWAIHGRDDTTVRPEEMLKMIRELRCLGSKPKLSLLYGDHSAGLLTYDSLPIREWMLNQNLQGNLKRKKELENLQTTDSN